MLMFAFIQCSLKWEDTVGEITTRRQKPLVLRIMVEQGRTMVLLLSGLTPRCAQIFPHRCCFQPVRRFRQRCPTIFVAAARKPSRRPGRARVAHTLHGRHLAQDVPGACDGACTVAYL